MIFVSWINGQEEYCLSSAQILTSWYQSIVDNCEGVGDVVGVEAPLGGVAQVTFHGVQVVEIGVQVRVHQDRGVEEDGEGQVEVEREVEELREKRTSWMTCRWSDGHMNDLSQEDHDT